MIRKLVRRLNESVVGRLSPGHLKIQVPIAVSIEPEPNGVRHGKTGKLIKPEQTPILRGKTVDLSAEGVAFIIPCIRLGQTYLAGEGRTLDIELDLPKGKVHLKAVGQRYEQLSQNASIVKYLIEAKISQMRAPDREIYTEFLKQGEAEKSGGKRLALGSTKG